jgi:peroxiredoxin
MSFFTHLHAADRVNCRVPDDLMRISSYNPSVDINQSVPDFSLPDQQGKAHPFRAYRGKIVVVNFWSAECPWSERADGHLMAVLKNFPDKVVILPVASNRNETSELIVGAIHQRGLDFVLVDAGCELADAWGAQTTPHAFVIDREGILRYMGAVDDVTFRKRNPEKFYVEEALKALLAGHLPEIQVTQPYGCTIVRSI